MEFENKEKESKTEKTLCQIVLTLNNNYWSSSHSERLIGIGFLYLQLSAKKRIYYSDSCFK